MVTAASLSSDALISINELARRRARLVLGWVTLFAPANVPSRYVTNDPGRGSALPFICQYCNEGWQRWPRPSLERNEDFYAAVCILILAADIGLRVMLTYLKAARIIYAY